MLLRSTDWISALPPDGLSDLLRQDGHQLVVLPRVEDQRRRGPLGKTFLEFVTPAAVGDNIRIFVDAKKIRGVPGIVLP